MIVIDVVSESDGVENLNRARVNENATDNQTYDATNDIAPGQVHFLEKEQTPNVQRPTSNAQWQNQAAALDVERWALSVGRLLHLVLAHSSHPPCKTKMLFSPA